MKDTLASRKLAMLFGNLFLHIVGYLAINAYLVRQGVSHNLATAWDYQIPFIKYFAPFYSMVYLIPVLTFVLAWNDYDTIKAAAKAFALAGVICFSCFLLFPVKYELRAHLDPPYDFYTDLLRFFYWADEPYNCFPSLHVALAFISAFTIRRCRPNLAPCFFLLAVIISVSILFMKQHYILDLLGGLFVSALMVGMFLFPMRSAYFNPQPSSVD